MSLFDVLWLLIEHATHLGNSGLIQRWLKPEAYYGVEEELRPFNAMGYNYSAMPKLDGVCQTAVDVE